MLLSMLGGNMMQEAGCTRPLGVTAVVSNVNNTETATYGIIKRTGMFVSYHCLKLNVQWFKKQNSIFTSMFTDEFAGIT